jgi:predicted small lipoprotein YifL
MERCAVALRDRSTGFRIALAGTIVAALALSACGRKGALEAPPHAKLTADQPLAKLPGDPPPADQLPPKPKKPDRPFFLDPLL